MRYLLVAFYYAYNVVYMVTRSDQHPLTRLFFPIYASLILSYLTYNNEGGSNFPFSRLPTSTDPPDEIP